MDGEPEGSIRGRESINVQHLTSNHLDPVARVTICTIQRLYSMLRGDAELPEGLDEVSAEKLVPGSQPSRLTGIPASAALAVVPTRQAGRLSSAPVDVAYNAAIPIEFFDFIVTDECHRSIYNLWRQVLEYFDAFLVGLTATPALQTIAFFQQNLVMEYGHERAVADGVNVGYDVYRIHTEVTAQGGKVDKASSSINAAAPRAAGVSSSSMKTSPTPLRSSTAPWSSLRRSAPCSRRSRTRWRPIFSDVRPRDATTCAKDANWCRLFSRP